MADFADTPAVNGGHDVNTLKGMFQDLLQRPPIRTATHKSPLDAQAALDQVANGPVAQNVKDQTAKTGAEFNNLAASRQTPANPAATGQPLTHYHSFFTELLSWKNPRASGIAYASVVTLIFAVRYLDVLRWSLKLTYLALGVTVAAEVLGKTVLNTGLATQLRPRKYYTISKETLNSMIGDVHELINFFVIEAQRVLFAENVYASAAACVAAFLSYYLVKIVPYWGLALIATTTLFFVPLVYTSNQELIDHHLQQASDIVNSQTAQLREVASKHTSHATEITKQYMGDYTAKAQSMLRGHSAASDVTPKPAKEYTHTDFPTAPKEVYPEAPKDEFKVAEPAVKAEEEPLI
ncbi:uncharacterized protein E0L32_011386 [Thyridium curvatum]|uniref:Reticulon-like protein n=1 Tax=Thyridium curvatum TaxID=1093900 RepID=A0A507BPZ7_9PEZI|nr:uncharacterized protein E0L32_011386 [Thyridium curvatum]TPX18908.1 hypothetical protein E0L32_011386 [Thyridium curvatum]